MLAANANEQSRLGSQFALAEEIEGMYRKLLSNASTSRLEYLNALREKLRVEDLRAQAIEKQDQIRERLTQAKVQRQAFISGWHTQTATQLMEALQNLAEVEQNLAKASRRNELVELTAVADSVVKDVAPLSEGSVLRQAETFCTLIPIDAAAGALEAEVAIAAMDIGHIQPGNAVRLKLTAFPFQRHGFLDGTVRMVSPDAFVQDGAQSGGDVHYKARIRLTSAKLQDVGPQLQTAARHDPRSRNPRRQTPRRQLPARPHPRQPARSHDRTVTMRKPRRRRRRSADGDKTKTGALPQTPPGGMMPPGPPRRGPGQSPGRRRHSRR